jgi:hypothetical protein
MSIRLPRHQIMLVFGHEIPDVSLLDRACAVHGGSLSDVTMIGPVDSDTWTIVSWAVRAHGGTISPLSGDRRPEDVLLDTDAPQFRAIVVFPGQSVWVDRIQSVAAAMRIPVFLRRISDPLITHVPGARVFTYGGFEVGDTVTIQNTVFRDGEPREATVIGRGGADGEMVQVRHATSTSTQIHHHYLTA